MKMEEDFDFSVRGMTAMWDDPIELRNGWQMVSYFPRDPVNAEVALSGIEDQLIMAKDGEGRFYNVAWEFSNMGDLREGQGYLLKMDGAGELVYRFEREDEVNEQVRQTKPEHLPVHQNTGLNMSLLVICETDKDLEVGIFSDNELIGSGKIINNRCGIAVWGDDLSTEINDGALENDEIRVAVFDGEDEIQAEIEWLEGKSTYQSNSFGALKINTNENIPTEFGITNLYPNPFNSSVKIDYSIDHTDIINLTIFDVNGREVAQIFRGSKNPGRYSNVWHAPDRSSGIYFVKLKSGDKQQISKVTLIR